MLVFMGNCTLTFCVATIAQCKASCALCVGITTC